MSRIDSYFSSLEKSLRADFIARRTFVKDSDVKGSANEKQVGEFIRNYFHPATVVYNKQVIDSYGTTSDEVDICVCNADQPAPDTDLIIAEGIDCVVQVKAVIDDRELDRIISNAVRVEAVGARGIGRGYSLHTSRGHSVLGRSPPTLCLRLTRNCLSKQCLTGWL